MSNAIASPPQTPAPSSKRRWRAIAVSLLCLSTLTSCTHGTVRTPEIPQALLALTAPLPEIGEDLLAPCPDRLPPAVDASIAGLARNHLESAAIYHDCKSGKGRLAESYRERQRIELERIERARRAIEARTDGGRP